MLKCISLRKHMGYSQAEVARRAGINQTSLSRIERGLEPAFPIRGKRIAKALGWEGNLDDLFAEEDDEL